MRLDERAYALALLNARLAINFDESKHPRDLKGRFRKGSKIRTLTGVGTVVRVEGDKVVHTYEIDGKIYEGSRPLRDVVSADRPIRPADVETPQDLKDWGIFNGLRIEPGESMKAETLREIATALDVVWHKYPEFQREKHTRAVGMVWATSATDDSEFGGGEGAKFIEQNPKIVMTQKRDMSASNIWINDKRTHESMRELTNPSGDKKVSEAHSRFAGLVLHELGHTLYYERAARRHKQGNEKERIKSEFARLGEAWIRDHVSDYAASSPVEFHAEAFALLNADWVDLDTHVRKELERVIG